jgi:phage shock protein A
MGIFTRFRDIISSNINAMLDKAEDPEKLIKLMIREMEDTLVELKASCAGVMASMKKTQRQMDEVQSRSTYWEERAALAVRKGRDDLAREALLEKRRYGERAGALEEELSEHNMLVAQYQEDIGQLEAKLTSAREKQRMLQQRHIHARRKMRAQEDIRRMETSDAIFRFEEFEHRIERMEAEADMVNFGRKQTLKGELDGLLADDDIERELQGIKASFSSKDEGASPA